MPAAPCVDALPTFRPPLLSFPSPLVFPTDLLEQFHFGYPFHRGSSLSILGLNARVAEAKLDGVGQGASDQLLVTQL